MQSLCTLRTPRCRDARNTHYRAARYALPGRDLHPLDRASFPGAPCSDPEYARRFWRLYPQILWVDARVGLESGFALLFEKLFPGRAGEDLKQPDEARLALVELSGKQDRLLVIDNVEDAESVRPWLPHSATTGCRTLITSRFSDFPAASGMRSIPLEVLEPGGRRRGWSLQRAMSWPRRWATCRSRGSRRRPTSPPPAPGSASPSICGCTEAAAADLLARKALGSTEYPDAVMADDGGETVAGIARRAAPVRLVR